MSRLIDADALLVSMWKMLYALEDKAEKDFVGTDNHDEWFYTFRPWLQRGHEIGVIAVNDAPTVDAVPVVHGHWEMKWHILFHQELPACSCCGKFVVTANLYTTKFMYTYCPLCGALMDEVTE